MFELAKREDIKIAAESTKQLYDGFVDSGFTEEKALELTKTMLSAVIRKGSG